MYGHVITKFSGMGRFTYPWCSAGALRAPELRYNLSQASFRRHSLHNSINTVPQVNSKTICFSSLTYIYIYIYIYRIYMGVYKLYMGVYKVYMGLYKVYMGVYKVTTRCTLVYKGVYGYI